MAFTYDAGLRIRPPEPMPDCLTGETPQDYFARVLTQCSLESATSAENASGDSAPTPFNIGQIQSDVARNTADIAELTTEVGDLTTKVDALEIKFASGTVSYGANSTQAAESLPSTGTWRVMLSPLGQALPGLYVVVATSSFVAHFETIANAGSIAYFAYRED
jgi:hypothetical protein